MFYDWQWNNIRGVTFITFAIWILYSYLLYGQYTDAFNFRSIAARLGLWAPTVADEWQDNIFPYRNQTSWNISNDFPYPRTLEYEVENGTWLRLDVHPTSGDIIFDMIGDIYCIPWDKVSLDKRVVSRHVLRGIPYDAEPRFSYVGDRIVFRSDAGMGVENIWVMPWRGCREHSRSDAQAITNETFRYVSGARFHPSDKSIIASKWFTSTITIGASEGWQYPLDGTAGNGHRVIGRTVSPGQDYFEKQVGPEQLLWHTNDTIIYSKNIRVDYRYSDDGYNVHQGTFSIFSHNTTTGKDEILVEASPGGASRPEISRDGRTLAFVRRERDHEILVLKDLVTGTIHHVWDGLTYDASVSMSSPMGTYPSFAFSPSDDAVIIWAAGNIYKVPLYVNRFREKVAHPTIKPYPIRFVAHIKKQLAETLTTNLDLVGLETQNTQRIHAFKELSIDENGEKAVMQAAGVTVLHDLKSGRTSKVPVVHRSSPYYAPSFVPKSHFIIHARWSDANFTSFELANSKNGLAHEVIGLPFGRYAFPTVSAPLHANHGQRKLAFIKSRGDLLTGDIVATALPGLYIADLDMVHSQFTVSNIHFVSSTIHVPPVGGEMKFLDPSHLLVQMSSHSYIIDLEGPRDIYDRPPYRILASGRASNAVVIAPNRRKNYRPTNVAFLEFQHIYIAKENQAFTDLWAKPGNATQGIARVTLHGGHDVTWSGDGKRLFWLHGPTLFSLQISKLDQCEEHIQDDELTYGVECVHQLAELHDIKVHYWTDISRLKQDAHRHQGGSATLVIANATILTMEHGSVESDVIREGTLLVKDGVISAVGPSTDIVIPHNATVIDVEGGFVVPGFIDVHAHWGGYLVRYPAKSWEMETFLAYGVTTVHNPSSDTVNTHVERIRLESGQFIGPRILTTGNVIFSGGWVGIHEEIVDMDQAYAALKRIKAEAGPVTLSYKNYQLPSRASRQRLLLAARELGMLCFPEGGGNYDWDITYILDGMTSMEHSFPTPIFYDDLLVLFAKSGTATTPTHIVNYGGPWGEQLVWASEDIPNDPKLRRFTRHDTLEELSETIIRPANSYAITNTSISIAKMVQKGLRTHIGAHGESPKGLNYHAEMAFTQLGGLTNYEVLRAATKSAAVTLGLDSSIGSLVSGKLADFLIYPRGQDLLDGPIASTRNLQYVIRGGRVWNASTMDEVWPLQKQHEAMPPFNPTD